MAAKGTDSEYLSSNLYKIRHSTAHVMAQAVLEAFPEAKIAIGPPIRDGFYYDFDLPRPLTDADLESIELRMKEILKEEQPFICEEIDLDAARSFFYNQPYKLELIDAIVQQGTDEYGNPLEEGQSAHLTVYKSGSFTDLCRGPHVATTKAIRPECIKLLRVAGAYWRGDETRPMLQRIYGTAFESKKELRQYLEQLEEAKKRDHRVLGKQLGLFSFSEEVGQGLPLWHPKGALIRHLAERFSQEAHLLNDYEWVVTPHIGRAQLWETSGHLDFYRDSMYRPMDIEGEDYFIKPMNCPFHIHIYKAALRSYRELPIRFAEFGTVYRYERSGVVSGFTRVRGFTQDDAHIFCTPEQLESEIMNALRFSLYVLRAFGLTDFKAYVATRPDKKYVGTPENWERAQIILKKAVEAENLPYEMDEGGGAFYGPKIDLKLVDCIGREWQLSTVQFDFNLPERFGITYIGEDGQQHVPLMVHRALFGSFERFFAMLIEHYAGDFPLWLAPVQATLVPIADRHINFAQQMKAALRERGIRANVDDSNDRMQAKIRNSEMQKIPFCMVLGDREQEANQLSVRSRKDGNLGDMTIDAFCASVENELAAGSPRRIVD